jgi:hypothetical protein
VNWFYKREVKKKKKKEKREKREESKTEKERSGVHFIQRPQHLSSLCTSRLSNLVPVYIEHC